MSKYNDFKCFIGLHDCEIYKEINITDVRNNIIGKVIINRCKNCGKIKQIKIITIYEHL